MDPTARAVLHVLVQSAVVSTVAGLQVGEASVLRSRFNTKD